MSCETDDGANNWSFWGCGGVSDLVDVTITTSDDQALLPPSEFLDSRLAGGKWSKIPGYNSN